MKKTKFTFIDILITVFLIAVIGFGFIKVKSGFDKKNNAKTVHFAVMATKVNSGVKNVVSVGDEVTISLKEKAYAKVIGVSEEAHTESEFSPNKKKYVSEPVEGKSDLIIELECLANVSDTEILNGNVPIRVGAESNVRGKGYAFEGYIISIDDVE